MAALERHGLTVKAQRNARPRKNQRVDAELTIEYSGKRLSCAVELKHHLRPATLGATLQQLRTLPGKPMIVADYVAPPMAERLRELGVWFADAGGNIYLEDPPLLVWVTGRPRPKLQIQKPRARAFQPSGLQVLFALLCKPELADQPYREIARQAGVAHGTVGWVMAELPAMDFLAEYRNRRILTNYDKLLTQWAEAYARTLRPKLQLARYQAPRVDWWKEFNANEFDYVLGGEPAGALIVGHLKPERITLYGRREIKKFMTQFALHPAADGNVELLERFWNFTEDRAGTAPAPLVYADLLAEGDTRCIESAELIYQDLVDGFKQQA
ncbi:hypothetical protein WM2015_2851 [Wenzhouxiangella marina]|uniref:Uncharacterized protein n=2 Tax=Wenzhouxiangella marina TaxID=1579979 RepID=A0A0K0XZV6_9GAMM|nr:hypothetical protein WM2015_2851 [Wenzhouxiangella marina]